MKTKMLWICFFLVSMFVVAISSGECATNSNLDETHVAMEGFDNGEITSTVVVDESISSIPSVLTASSYKCEAEQEHVKSFGCIATTSMYVKDNSMSKYEYSENVITEDNWNPVFQRNSVLKYPNDATSCDNTLNCEEFHLRASTHNEYRPERNQPDLRRV